MSTARSEPSWESTCNEVLIWLLRKVRAELAEALGGRWIQLGCVIEGVGWLPPTLGVVSALMEGVSAHRLSPYACGRPELSLQLRCSLPPQTLFLRRRRRQSRPPPPLGRPGSSARYHA